MHYKQIKSDSLINKITNKDQLFKGVFTIDPYQNCEFGCKYCDSSFEKTIYIKTNSQEILEKKLTKLEPGRIIIGSVHDPYQKAEKKFKLTRNILKEIKKHRFPCHILTKSDLVLRDIDILSEIKDCMVTISMTSLDKSVNKIFENNIPSPTIRLKTIKQLVKNKIKTGVAVIPVLPFITDKTELEKIIKNAKKNQAQYIVYKYLELKGDQKTIFYNILEKHYPNLVDKYKKLYQDSFIPDKWYIDYLDKNIKKLLIMYNL